MGPAAPPARSPQPRSCRATGPYPLQPQGLIELAGPASRSSDAAELFPTAIHLLILLFNKCYLLRILSSAVTTGGARV